MRIQCDLTKWRNFWTRQLPLYISDNKISEISFFYEVQSLTVSRVWRVKTFIFVAAYEGFSDSSLMKIWHFSKVLFLAFVNKHFKSSAWNGFNHWSIVLYYTVVGCGTQNPLSYFYQLLRRPKSAEKNFQLQNSRIVIYWFESIQPSYHINIAKYENQC